MPEELRFVLSRLVLGKSRDVELSATEFHHLRAARDTLDRALEAEDKFDIVMEDFAELELEFLTLANREMTFGRSAYAEMADALNTVNRRLLHLMTAARTYVDQLIQDVAFVFGHESPQRAEAEQLFHNAYDSVAGYRVLEALRNYAQHRRLPVHALRFGWSRRPDANLVEYTVEYALDLTRLREDGRFKGAVLTELEGLQAEEDKVLLKPLVRAYVSALGRVHGRVREAMAGRVAECDELSASTVRRFVQETTEDVAHIHAAAIRQRGGRDAGVVDRFTLFSDVSTRRQRLVRKNPANRPLEIQYVSGAPLAGGS